MVNEVKFMKLVNALRDNDTLPLGTRYEYAAEIKRMFESVCAENQLLRDSGQKITKGGDLASCLALMLGQ